MTIEEQSAQRLVITHRRRGMAAVLVAFTLLSVFFVVSLMVHAVPRFPVMNSFQRLSWFLWVGLGIGFIYLGVMAWRNAAQGVICTFDRSTEEACLRWPGLWRSDERTLSLYAIARVRVEYNDDARVYGVFLMLRSSERIPIATVAPHLVDDARQTASTIQAFLQQPAPAPA